MYRHGNMIFSWMWKGYLEIVFCPKPLSKETSETPISSTENKEIKNPKFAPRPDMFGNFGFDTKIQNLPFQLNLFVFKCPRTS